MRAGTDIRVTVPPEYSGALALATSDNVEEDDYRNRGNVCVDRLGGAVAPFCDSTANPWGCR